VFRGIIVAKLLYVKSRLTFWCRFRQTWQVPQQIYKTIVICTAAIPRQ